MSDTAKSLLNHHREMKREVARNVYAEIYDEINDLQWETNPALGERPQSNDFWNGVIEAKLRLRKGLDAYLEKLDKDVWA